MNDTLCNKNQRVKADIEWKINCLTAEWEEALDDIYETKSALADTTNRNAITYLKEELADLIKEKEKTWKEVVRLTAQKKEMFGEDRWESMFIVLTKK